MGITYGDHLIDSGYYDPPECSCRQPGLGGDCDGSCQHPPPVDIVQKLRERANFAREEHTGTADADAWHFDNAADEIDRLRALVGGVKAP